MSALNFLATTGNLLTAAACIPLGLMLLHMTTRRLHAEPWLRPFLIAVGIGALMVGLGELIGALRAHFSVDLLYAVWSFATGVVVMLATLTTVLRWREDILRSFRAGPSPLLPGSRRYDIHPRRSDCDECVRVLNESLRGIPIKTEAGKNP